MSWIKVEDRLPPEGEQILIHDERNDRIEIGRYVRGRWYTENPQSGELNEILTVTHWGWLLDSQTQDDSEDD